MEHEHEVTGTFKEPTENPSTDMGSPTRIVYEETELEKTSNTVDAFIYEQSMDSTDEQLGDVQGFGWYGLLVFPEPVTVDQDGDEWTFSAAIIMEGNQGFIYVDYFHKESLARKAWAKLEEAYAESEDQEEDDDEGDDEGDEG